MSTNDSLQRDDIVGKRIKAIYQSPWYIEADGFGGCRTYVELDDGIAFGLLSQELGIIHPIIRVNLSDVNTMPTEQDVSQCIDRSVLEVLVSWYWPGMGLLLSGDLFLYCSDFPNACRSGALLIGPYAEPVGQTYQLTEVMPYWQQDRMCDSE